jgi:hypothetical protein
MQALAHTRNDNKTARVKRFHHQFYGAHESIAKGIADLLEPGDFHIEHALGAG